MKSSLKTTGLALVTALTIALPTTFAIADGHGAAVTERQEIKKQFGKNFGVLVGMAKGEKDYDSAEATAAVATLKELAMKVEPLWTEGTDNEAMPGKTRALPAIWDEGSEFGDILGNLIAATDEASGAVGNGLDALRPMVGKIGGNCQDCHKKYRARKE